MDMKAKGHHRSTTTSSTLNTKDHLVWSHRHLNPQLNRILCYYTLGPSPRFESSLLVNVLLVSMPESLVVESWLPCRSESHRDHSSKPGG